MYNSHRTMRRYFPFALLCAGTLLLLGCSSQEEVGEANAIVVSPNQSIQEVVERAPPGAVIHLPAGTWRENLYITKSLTLRGKNAKATVVVGQRPGQPVLRVSGEAMVNLSGMAIRGGHGGYGGPALSPAGVLVEGQAQVHLAGVEVAQNSGAGLAAQNEAQVEVVGSTISGNNRYGVEVWVQAQVVLRGTRVLQNKMGGVWVDEDGVFQAENTTIEENLGPGLWARGQSKVGLLQTEVRQSRGPGIHAQDTACVELRACRILDNQEHGVYLSGTSSLVAQDTAFHRNWYGLHLAGGQAVLDRCLISNNAWDGVRLRGRSSATITRTEIAQGQGSGVAVVDQARARLECNRITGFAVAGVYAFAASPVEGEGNVLEGNGAHILGWVVPLFREPVETARYEVLPFPHPDFPELQAAVDALLPGGILEIAGGNYVAAVAVDKPLEIRAAGDTILRGQGKGPVISVVNGGKLRLSGVHITGGSTGLALNAGSSAELESCWLWENTVGLELWYDAQLTATRVSISHHPQGGIWAWHESRALLEEVTLYANETCGIGVGGSAYLRVLRSTFVENAGQAAVLLLDQAGVELYDNVFSGNEGYGVDAVPSFAGRVEGGSNVFEGNWRGDVRLAELSFLGQ